jgi:hypothetical protein
MGTWHEIFKTNSTLYLESGKCGQESYTLLPGGQRRAHAHFSELKSDGSIVI